MNFSLSFSILALHDTKHHMKFLVIITAISLYLSPTYSQEKISLEKYMTTRLPANVKKSDSATVKTRLGTVAKSGVSLNRQLGNIYETDAGVIQINAAKGILAKGRLEEMEKALKEMIGWCGPKYLTSSIIKINNFKALFLDFQLQQEDIGRFSFYTINDSHDIAAIGTMEYMEGDSVRARKTLQNFLQGITF